MMNQVTIDYDNLSLISNIIEISENLDEIKPLIADQLDDSEITNSIEKMIEVLDVIIHQLFISEVKKVVESSNLER